MKKNEVEETAITTVADETEEEKDSKQSKLSFSKRFSGFLDTAKGGIDTINEFYTSWIKPVYDNRAQISRRLSMVSTIISIIFFMLYVPFLLFSKLSKDLSLGVDIALYVCIGVYVVTIIALLFVTFSSGKSTSTTMAKRHKQTRKIVLLIVRLASLAIGISALIISAASGSADSKTATLDTIAIIFAVMSIIFSSLPLVFGGMAGFFRWLISPARAKYKFSFVILEWYQSLTSDKIISKALKRAVKKYGERIGLLIDKYFLPQLGKKQIKSIDRAALIKLLDSIPEEDLNIAEWVTKETFDYADECGYIDVNPCKQLELGGNIELEGKAKKSTESAEGKQKGKFAALFTRKRNKKNDVEEE